MGKELKPEQIFALFDQEYLSVPKIYQLLLPTPNTSFPRGSFRWI